MKKWIDEVKAKGPNTYEDRTVLKLLIPPCCFSSCCLL